MTEGTSIITACLCTTPHRYRDGVNQERQGFYIRGELKQTATGRYVFDNEWQSFKTNNDDLELISAPRTYAEKGTYKVAVKVVDVFGNDTTKVFEVKVG